jgi:ssDNA-binding Zn-finger/Zn-ribbon topoisomerase 1
VFLATFRFFIVNLLEVFILKKNNRKSSNLPVNPRRCPYCGGSVVLRSADGIYKDNSSGTMLYVCSNFPACDAYVRVVPGTRQAVGTMASAQLRALRREAHLHFDRLHLSGAMSRDEAYRWLASMLQKPLSQTHIGQLGEYYCGRVIEESRRIMDNRQRVQGCVNLKRVAGGESYASQF